MRPDISKLMFTVLGFLYAGLLQKLMDTGFMALFLLTRADIYYTLNEVFEYNI